MKPGCARAYFLSGRNAPRHCLRKLLKATSAVEGGVDIGGRAEDCDALDFPTSPAFWFRGGSHREGTV